jgi:hypothetical protein
MGAVPANAAPADKRSEHVSRIHAPRLTHKRPRWGRQLVINVSGRSKEPRWRPSCGEGSPPPAYRCHRSRRSAVCSSDHLAPSPGRWPAGPERSVGRSSGHPAPSRGPWPVRPERSAVRSSGHLARSPGRWPAGPERSAVRSSGHLAPSPGLWPVRPEWAAARSSGRAPPPVCCCPPLFSGRRWSPVPTQRPRREPQSPQSQLCSEVYACPCSLG